MGNDILITPGNALINFSGASAGNINLQVQGDGRVSFIGISSGAEQLTIIDSLSGSVFTVNNSFGSPILDINFDNSITIPNGASDGYVWTSDSGGTATWEAVAGSSSASCITDLYVRNVHGCSPIHFYDGNVRHTIQSSGLLLTGSSVTGVQLGGPNPGSDIAGILFTGNLTGEFGALTQTNGTLAFQQIGQAIRGPDVTTFPTRLTSGDNLDLSAANNSIDFFISRAPVNKETIVAIVTKSGDTIHIFNGGDTTGAELTTPPKTFKTSGYTGGFILNSSNSKINQGVDSSVIIGGTDHNIGTGSTSSGIFAGSGNTITAPQAVVIGGMGNIASGEGSFAIGFGTTASGLLSHAGGYLTIASGNTSHAEGGDTIAGGTRSHAEGSGTKAFADHSHSEGNITIASGEASHAEGSETIASTLGSHAEGRLTIASGDYSHAEGIETTASGEASHAEGSGTTAIGDYSHAEGYFTTASGFFSHAEGAGTIASGTSSHAEGYETLAIGNYSHVEGLQASATTQNAHAEGKRTLASGDDSHAEGDNTSATGPNSHSGGHLTIADGANSHAGGSVSIALGKTSFIHSTNSLVTGERSVVLGGQNITGTTDDTVYVPNLDLCEFGGTLFTDSISGCSPIHVHSKVIFEDEINALSISATTYYGDGSNLTNISASIPNTIEVTQASDLPATLVTNTNYIINGAVTATNSVTATTGSSIIGRDKHKDILTYNGIDTFLTVNDIDFTISNITLRVPYGKVLDATNITLNDSSNKWGRINVLNITNAQIRNTNDVMSVTGFELVDLNNVLIWFVSGSTGCEFQSNRHLEMSSCEIFNWFPEGTTAATAYSTATMLNLKENAQGTGPEAGNTVGFAVVNLNSNIIHPEQQQIGLSISSASTTFFGTIAANTFIDDGITSGTLFSPPPQVGGYSLTSTINYDIGLNQGIPNSITYGMSYSTGTTSTLNNTSFILMGGATGWADANTQRMTVESTGWTQYNGTKPIYISISATIYVEAAGGNDSGEFALGLAGTTGINILQGSVVGWDIKTGNNKVTVPISYSTTINENEKIGIFGKSTAGEYIINGMQLSLKE